MVGMIGGNEFLNSRVVSVLGLDSDDMGIGGIGPLAGDGVAVGDEAAGTA
jgi:hypothetical protein